MFPLNVPQTRQTTLQEAAGDGRISSVKRAEDADGVGDRDQEIHEPVRQFVQNVGTLSTRHTNVSKSQMKGNICTSSLFLTLNFNIYLLHHSSWHFLSCVYRPLYSTGFILMYIFPSLFHTVYFKLYLPLFLPQGIF